MAKTLLALMYEIIKCSGRPHLITSQTIPLVYSEIPVLRSGNAINGPKYVS